MQLLLILMLLMYGGKGENAGLFKELKPLLESVGGDEVKEALKSAEELEGVLSAFGNFGAEPSSGGKEHGVHAEECGGVKNDSCAKEERSAQSFGEQQSADGGFPLAPIAGIADREILYRLVQYFSRAGTGA